MSSIFKPAQLITLLLLITLSACSEPQPEEPEPRRKSPIAIASITHQPTDTYLKVVYGQPYKRGRQIFGNIVPFGETWRTGANEATEFTTTGDILFAGNQLEAGTYALFTIPRQDSTWTVILNNDLGQWGDFEYNAEEDELRVEVPARQTEQVTEAFTIHFSDITTDSTRMIMNWDQTEVAIPIIFEEE